MAVVVMGAKVQSIREGLIIVQRKRSILLVDDSPHEGQFLDYMLRREELGYQLHTVCDADSAIEWLKGEGKFANRESHPTPDVLITDLRMPGKQGLEVVEWVRGQEQFAQLPVLVVSASDDSV